MLEFNLIEVGIHGQWLTIHSDLGLMIDLDTRWVFWSLVAVAVLRTRKIIKDTEKRGK